VVSRRPKTLRSLVLAMQFVSVSSVPKPSYLFGLGCLNPQVGLEFCITQNFSFNSWSFNQKGQSFDHLLLSSWLGWLRCNYQ